MIPGFVEAETSDRVAQKMSSNSSLEDIRRKLEEETLENERLRRKNIELYDRLRSEQERYRRDLDIATTEVQRTRKQLTHDREKTKKLETQLEQSQSMLRTRSDELRNVQDILAITDEPSDSEILHLIQDINAATYQCSAQLAEGWPFTLKKTTRDADDVVLRMVGKGMINVLQSGPHEEQQVLTQIAIQAFFAASVTWMISAWTFHSETLLAELYNTLHKNETQITGGIWRSLTLRHVEDLPKVKEKVSGLHLDSINILTRILLLSGVEGVPDDIYQEVRRRGGKRIHDIIRLAFLVRKLTRLKVITCDFASKVVAYGDKYIPESMEMTYRDEELEQKGHQLVTKVFCTTEIGLIRSQKYPKDAEGKMRQRVSIALKPKVVLESQIREMVGKGPDASPECSPKLMEEGHNQG